MELRARQRDRSRPQIFNAECMLEPLVLKNCNFIIVILRKDLFYLGVKNL